MALWFCPKCQDEVFPKRAGICPNCGSHCEHIFRYKNIDEMKNSLAQRPITKIRPIVNLIPQKKI